MSSPVNPWAGLDQSILALRTALASLPAPQPIAIVNQSTVVTDAELTPVIEALHIQINRDFAPIWGSTAKLVQFSKPQPGGIAIPPSYWQIVVLDDATMAGALGYHDITASGQPLGKVFAKTTKDDGMQWSVTLSHELMEVLGDPFVNICCEVDSENGVPTRFYALEVADAPESDEHGYHINGVLVSDFVTPAWFMPGMPGPYDFLKKITEPFELLLGGYISFLDVKSRNGWQQMQAQHSTMRPDNRPHLRLKLRRKSRGEWQRSTL